MPFSFKMKNNIRFLIIIEVILFICSEYRGDIKVNRQI